MPPVGAIGRNVRRLRDARGWSQSELARRSGVSQSFISELERGKREDALGGILQALARTLGVTVDELLREPSPAKEDDATEGR